MKENGLEKIEMAMEFKPGLTERNMKVRGVFEEEKKFKLIKRGVEE